MPQEHDRGEERYKSPTGVDYLGSTPSFGTRMLVLSIQVGSKSFAHSYVEGPLNFGGDEYEEVGSQKKKEVTISISFDGPNSGWENLASNMKLAEEWFNLCI